MRIIGSDYDGTLNHNGIDAAKIAAIGKWRKAGNVFAVVSGRSVGDMMRFYNEKKFGCDYFVANNGAVITKPDGTVIADNRCDGKIAAELLELMLENGCPCGFVVTEFPFGVYASESEDMEKGGYLFEDMPEVPWFYQISTFLPDFETAAKVTACIREHFGDKLNPLQNGICIDIVRKDVNKANGLYLLAKHLGVGKNDIIAVGDNINDRDMIAEFRSYAMANGVDSIKALADYVTEGITELIEKELE